MKLKKALEIILHILGFPLLIALVVVSSLSLYKAGISYGIMVFVGLIITVVMAIIYYLVFFLMAKSGKKTIQKQTIISIIVAAICLGGLWIVIDVALPDLLKDATSDTIYYEDLIDDFNARAEVNKNLLDEYIKRNVANGNLTKLSEKEYLEQGARNKEVMALLKSHFESIDKDGYATFVGPWIDMANDGRLTIPTLVHLIVNKREVVGVPYPLKEADDPVMWSILDMLGEPMEFELLPENISGIVGTFQTAINNILLHVTNAIEDENVVGSPIYIGIEGPSIVLTPSNVSRGVLDYQSMAWLNSNGLIFMITSLLSVRKLFLIFAGVLILTTYAIGLLRESQAKNAPSDGKFKGKEAAEDSLSDNSSIDFNINAVTDAYNSSNRSYAVINSNPSALDFNKMTQQLLYDACNNISRRYEAGAFQKQ